MWHLCKLGNFVQLLPDFRKFRENPEICQNFDIFPKFAKFRKNSQFLHIFTKF